MTDIKRVIRETFTRAESLGFKQDGHTAAYVHRANLIADVKEALCDPSELPILYGKTGVGKTSILKRAIREIQQEQAAQIGFRGEPIELQPNSLKASFQQTILPILAQKGIRVTDKAVQYPELLFKDFDDAEILVIFDNFQGVINVNPTFTDELLDFAKGFCAQWAAFGRSRLVVVFSSTENELDNMLEGSIYRPARTVAITPFTKSQLRGIIQDGVNKIRLCHYDFGFDPKVVEQTVSLSFGLPATTHILAREVALTAIKRNRKEVLEMDFEDLRPTGDFVRQLAGGIVRPARLRYFTNCECAMVAWAGHNKQAMILEDFKEGLEGFFDTREIRSAFDKLAREQLFDLNEGDQTLELREWLVASIAMLELKRRITSSRRKERVKLQNIYSYLLTFNSEPGIEQLERSDDLSVSLPESVRGRYSSAILAIQDDARETYGTGFLVLFTDEIYVVTCAHVLKSLSKSEGDTVKLSFSILDHVWLDATVCWMRPPQDVEPELWSAVEDIAILNVDNEALPSRATPFKLDAKEPNGKTDCFCFAYVERRRPKGAWLKDISCGAGVGNGFIELKQAGQVLVDKGASGAPLGDRQGKILGMIQSVHKKDEVAYLTPSEEIIEVLHSLTKAKENKS